jgi:hypothetical protein
MFMQQQQQKAQAQAQAQAQAHGGQQEGPTSAAPQATSAPAPANAAGTTTTAAAAAAPKTAVQAGSEAPTERNYNYTKATNSANTANVNTSAKGSGSNEPTPAEAAVIKPQSAAPVAVAGVDLAESSAPSSGAASESTDGRPSSGAGRGGRGGRGGRLGAGGRGVVGGRGGRGIGVSRANANRQAGAGGTASDDKRSGQNALPSAIPDQENIAKNINSEKNTRRAPINININRVKYPHGQMMTTSDVKFVTEKVLTALRFTDPYTQDFYYLQKGLRTNATLRERAIKEQTAMPQMIMVPQPLWRDFKDRIQLTLLTQKEKLLGKTTKV